MLAPAGTPEPIVDRLNEALERAMALPDVVQAMQQQGALVVSTTPPEAVRRVEAEVAMWARVIRDAKIKAE